MTKPKYKELEIKIFKTIENYEPNQIIPSERELCELYDSSRMTVRKAVDNLVAKGYLYKVKTKGTFVSQQKFRKLYNNLTGFTQEVEEAGGTVKSVVISFEEMSATGDIPKKLKIAEGELVYKLVRLRCKDNIPFIVDESYFPKKIVPLNDEIINGSIYSYVENDLKLIIVNSVQELSAVNVPEEYIDIMRLDKLEPIIQVEAITFLSDNIPLEYSISYKNSKVYKIFVNAVKI